MDSNHLTRLLRAAYGEVHRAETYETIDIVRERILALLVRAAAGRVESIAIVVVNSKGNVAASARLGRVASDHEPHLASTQIVEPTGTDNMAIRLTVVETNQTSPRTDASAVPAVDILNILALATTVITLAVDVLSLHAAIEHRDDLATAKGILMERNHIDAKAAFALLARYSQDTNTKAALVARRVIDVR